MTESKEEMKVVVEETTGKQRAESGGYGKLTSTKTAFASGEQFKESENVELPGNRHTRRKGIRTPKGESVRLIKRTQRVMELKEIAQQIKEWYPDTFKDNHKWKEIEKEMIKLLGRKGESNVTKPKKRR
jgi:hypothetical protein